MVSKFKVTINGPSAGILDTSRVIKLNIQGLQSLVIFKNQWMNGCHHPMMEDHNSSRSIVGPTFDDGDSDLPYA